MSVPGHTPYRITKLVLHVLCAVFCVIGIIATIVVLSFFMAAITQPTDKAISTQATPHEKGDVRVWRLPSKDMQKRLPPRKEA